MSLFINFRSSIHEISKEEIKTISDLKNKIKFSLKVPKHCQILSKEMKLIVSGSLEENDIFDNSTIVLSIIKEPFKCRKNKKKLKYKKEFCKDEKNSNFAVKYCYECNSFLCSDCYINNHKEINIFKEHKIEKVSKLLKENIYCNKHKKFNSILNENNENLICCEEFKINKNEFEIIEKFKNEYSSILKGLNENLIELNELEIKLKNNKIENENKINSNLNNKKEETLKLNENYFIENFNKLSKFKNELELNKNQLINISNIIIQYQNNLSLKLKIIQKIVKII